MVPHLKPFYEAAKRGQLAKARLIIDHVENRNPKDIVQGLRWHGFEGFDQTLQFLDRSSGTRQFLGISKRN